MYMENSKNNRATVLNAGKQADGILPRISTVHTEPYANYILRLLFEASPDGFFAMMLNQPVDWNPRQPDEVLFNHIYKTQQITLHNKRSIDLNPGFKANLLGVSPERYFSYDTESGKSAWKKLLNSGWLHMETSEEISPGMFIWIETEFVNLYDNSGKLLGCFATQRDYSHRYSEIDSLNKSNSDLSSAISAIGDPLIMTDANGVVTYLNYSAEVTLDLNYDQLINKRITEILQVDDPETGLNLKSILEQVKSGGLNYRFSNKSHLKFGIKETNITGVVSAVKNEEGTHIGWMLLLRYPGEVLTEVVEDKINLARMKRHHGNIESGYWEIDLNEGKVWIGDDMFRLFGIRRVMKDDPEELKYLQTKMNEMIVSEDRSKVEQAAGDLINKFQGYSLDYRIIDQETKRIRYMRSVVEVHKDASGNPSMISGSALDLTWYYDEVTKLSFFKELVEAAPVGILITDPSGIITFINKKITEITGFEPAELIGNKPSIFKSGVLPPQFYENLWRVVLSGEVWQGDIINRKKDGSHYWDSASIAGIKDKTGDIVSLSAFKTDVTRRKKLESEVKKQRDQLDQLHKEKVMLLENLSHEIRNPLNGISGFLDLLISEVTDYNQRKLLKSIKHSSERIRNRLDAVTDILNIEKDSWQINLKTSDISNVLSEVLAYYREMAEEKGLRFDTYIQENLKVVTDPQLISKAVGNLLDNAVKFTTEGSIRVEILSPPVEGGEIIIKVTDTGSGIKKESIDAIFRETPVISSDISPIRSGNGFGLKVTKEILKKLGGTIKIESVPGKRTSFTIILNPAQFSEQNIEEDDDKIKHFQKIIAPDKLHEILIVEDSRINSDVIALYLRRICTVDSAKNGEIAIKMAKEKNYSMVILDINLGEGLSGVETMKKIRSFSGYELIPFIAVTGYTLNSDKKTILEEGFDFFYTKPLDISKFTDFIKDLLLPENAEH